MNKEAYQNKVIQIAEILNRWFSGISKMGMIIFLLLMVEAIFESLIRGDEGFKNLSESTQLIHNILIVILLLSFGTWVIFGILALMAKKAAKEHKLRRDFPRHPKFKGYYHALLMIKRVGIFFTFMLFTMPVIAFIRISQEPENLTDLPTGCSYVDSMLGMITFACILLVALCFISFMFLSWVDQQQKKQPKPQNDDLMDDL